MGFEVEFLTNKLLHIENKPEIDKIVTTDLEKSVFIRLLTNTHRLNFNL